MDDFDWDFSDDDDYYGRRGNWRFQAGCLLVIGAIIFAIIAVAWIVHHRRQIEVVLFFAILATGGWLARGYFTPLFQRRPRLDSTATPTPLAQLKPGAVHTTGLVGLGAAPLHAPLGAPAC